MVRAVGNVLECILRRFLSVWGLPKDPRKLAKFKSPSVIQALNFKDAVRLPLGDSYVDQVGAAESQLRSTEWKAGFCPWSPRCLGEKR